jgi:probable HAF family extracellular repeat protein
MNQIKRIIRSNFGKALTICAFALTFMSATSAAFDSQESGGTELTLTQFDIPGARQTLPSGINDLGQIVGRYQDKEGIIHGFLWDGFSYMTIKFPQAIDTAPNGINNLGKIVGNFLDEKGKVHGFLYNNGDFKRIDHPDAFDITSAQAINDHGQIIGYYNTEGRQFNAYLLNQGVFTPIDFPASSYTEPLGINNNGEIVGEYGIGQTGYAFHLKDGVFRTINFRDAISPSAAGINRIGQIVGVFRDDTGISHGFLLYNPVLTTIDFPGASGPSIDIPDFSGTQAYGINNNGVIVGAFVDASGLIHGFLATEK